MGNLLDSLVGNSSDRDIDDYVAIDFGDVKEHSSESPSGLKVHMAVIHSNTDLLDVKDALYAGDVVIANLDNTDNSITPERIVKRLEVVARDVGGDIVRKSGGELLVAPAGVSVSRSVIGG